MAARLGGIQRLRGGGLRTLVVPAGHRDGSLVSFSISDGRRVETAVPPRLWPGDTFVVEVSGVPTPALTPEAAMRQTQLDATAAATAAAAAEATKARAAVLSGEASTTLFPAVCDTGGAFADLNQLKHMSGADSRYLSMEVQVPELGKMTVEGLLREAERRKDRMGAAHEREWRADCDARDAARAAARARAAAEEEAAQAAEAEARHGALANAAVEAAAAETLDVVPLGLWAAEAMATWRNRPDGQRSAEAKKKRRKKKAGSGGGGGGKGTSIGSGDGGAAVGEAAVDEAIADGAMGREQLLRELLATRQALKDRGEVLALTRRQQRRDAKTAKVRWQKLARRGSKAQKKLSRQLFAKKARGIAGAARKERERIRKRKQPEGEVLHSSARKHQRRLEQSGKGGGSRGRGAGGGGGGGGGRGRGGGRGGSTARND